MEDRGTQIGSVYITKRKVWYLAQRIRWKKKVYDKGYLPGFFLMRHDPSQQILRENVYLDLPKFIIRNYWN